MPSEKASFHSKDPNSGSSNTPDALTDDAVVPAKDDAVVPAKKASFYSSDPTPGTSDVSEPGKKKYMGAERRKEDRRKAKDRRDDVRFDLTKTDRRQIQGRREKDATPKFW
jgi:hypothetical protein